MEANDRGHEPKQLTFQHLFIYETKGPERKVPDPSSNFSGAALYCFSANLLFSNKKSLNFVKIIAIAEKVLYIEKKIFQEGL